METEKGNSKWKVQTMNDLHGTAYYTNSNREESHQDINRVLDEYKDIIKDLDAESVSIQMIAKNGEGQVVLERLNMREDRNIFVVNGDGIRIDAPTHLDAVAIYDRLVDATLLTIGSMEYAGPEDQHQYVLDGDEKEILHIHR